jgi:hypothetical protein
MANADLKTKKTSASVGQFIDSIKDEKRREDSRRMLDIMHKASGEEPKMWGQVWWGLATITSKKK